MTALETRKVVVLSTAHLRPETCASLAAMPLDAWPCSGAPLPFGFYIYAHDEDVGDGVTGEGISAFAPELWSSLTFARQQGFDYVQFDCDADPIAQLESFDHEGDRQ